LRKKQEDTFLLLHDQKEFGKELLQEHDTARLLIAEALTKLASASQTSSSNNLKAARVAQIMLDAGKQKLQ